MNVTAHTTPEVFEALKVEWNDLLHRASIDTLFLTREWQRVWWRMLGDGEMRVLAMRDESNTLVGIAPLFFDADASGQRYAAFVGCKEVSDYLDFIFERDRAEECYQALADYLASNACPPWDRLVLCNIPESSPTFTHLPHLACLHGWRTEQIFEDVSPIIQLPATFDAYLAMLGGKERRELQRKLRRASDEVAITFATDAATLDRDMDDFLRLMVASMPSKAEFMTPRMSAFFHAVAREMFDAGMLQLSFMEVRGERAATYLNFIYANQVLVYNSGLDPYKFAQISPGQVLLGRLIEQAIADKRSAFDFLQGNEEYKHKLGGKDMRLYTLVVHRK